MDNYPGKSTGGSSNSIDVKVAKGKDVFLYTQTHTNYDENGETSTASSTQQFYPVEGRTSGITQSSYAFGMLSSQDNDKLTLAKFSSRIIRLFKR